MNKNQATELPRCILATEPLRKILAGHKRFELRLSFRGLARSVSEGDVLLLKRVAGEVEAACDVGRYLCTEAYAPRKSRAWPVPSPTRTHGHTSGATFLRAIATDGEPGDHRDA
jgi:hypothetical protein